MGKKRRAQKSKGRSHARTERRSPKIYGSALAAGKGRVRNKSARRQSKSQLIRNEPDEIFLDEPIAEVVNRLADLEMIDDLGADISGPRRLGRVIEVYKGHCLLEDFGLTVDNDADRPPSDAPHDIRAVYSERIFEAAAERLRISGRPRRYVRAEFRGLTHAFNIGTKNIVAAGDRVRYVAVFEPDKATDLSGVIVSREPRSSCLSRPAWGGVHIQHIAANIHQIVAVISFHKPPFRPGLMDRYAIYAESENIPLMFVVNKVDLAVSTELPDSIDSGESVLPSAQTPLPENFDDMFPADDPASVIREFRELGYPVLLTDALNHAGVSELEDRIRGKVSVFSGHSGVGKSTLLNALIPSLDLLRGKISKHTGKGRHTTTRTTWLPLPAGGAVIDTPGLRTFGLYGVSRAMLGHFFRDIKPWVNRCRFPDCTHVHEPDCAVRRAVREGHVSLRRYFSYKRILETLPDNVG